MTRHIFFKFFVIFLILIVGAHSYAPLPSVWAATSPKDDTFDWWPSDATPGPVKDNRENHHGSWWWPFIPDQLWPLWGNRGVPYLLKGAQGMVEATQPAKAEASASQGAGTGLQFPCFGNPFAGLWNLCPEDKTEDTGWQNKNFTGGYVKMSGKYRLAAGIDGDFIVNDANRDLQEKNWRFLFGERLNNTYDQAIYSQYLLDVDFAPYEALNFHTRLVADPWSVVGTTGEQMITDRGGTSTLRPNFKYFGANNSVLGEIYRSNTDSSLAFPVTKVIDGRTTAYTTTGLFGEIYDVPELEIDYEFRPLRELWMDYTQEQWHLRVFALASQDQALTTDDPLMLSNRHDWWQWSPWTHQYMPVQHFTGGAIKRGYYSDSLPYLARDSANNELILLKGVSFEAEFDRLNVATTWASPQTPWEEEYFTPNNVEGATRAKYQLTDTLMLGTTHTYRGGYINHSLDSENYVIAGDVEIKPTKELRLRGEVAYSNWERDMLSGPRNESNIDDMAYRGIADINFDHAAQGHTDFQFDFTSMGPYFQPQLSNYFDTRDDEFWGKHITFQEISPDLEAFRLGDGIDIGRYVFRLNWKESLWDKKLLNHFDVRNVHDDEGDYVENVLRDEVTYQINSQWTTKGLFRWHGMPRTLEDIEPFLSGSRNRVDPTDTVDFMRNFDIPPNLDANRFTYAYALQYVMNPEWTFEGYHEITNDVPDFPRGLLNFTFRDAPGVVENILIDRLQSGFYGQPQLGGIPRYEYFNITRERVVYTPDERVRVTFHAAQNGYKWAAGIDDNVNHQGVAIEVTCSKKWVFFADYTHSNQLNLPLAENTGFVENRFEGHHNIYASLDYKVSPHQLLKMEYGVFGIGGGLSSNTGGLVTTQTYSPISFSLPTIDTEHLFRLSLTGEF